MKDAIEILHKVRTRCEEDADRLAAKYKSPNFRDPIGGLNISFEAVTVSLELLDHYYAIWNQRAARTGQQLQDEDIRRVIFQTKAAFVWCMSAMEFSLRQAAHEFQAVLSLSGTDRFHSLAKMMGKAHAVGLIDATKHAQWLGVIELRHVVIHNNGVATENRDTALPDGTEIKFRIGKNVRVMLRDAPNITGWALSEYAILCDDFLTRAGA